MRAKKVTIAIAIIVIVLLVSTIPLISCDNVGYNKQIFDFNYEYTNAYVKIGDEWKDIEIKSWTDYEDGEQLQIILKDGTVMLVSSYTCILYKGSLPK